MNQHKLKLLAALLLCLGMGVSTLPARAADVPKYQSNGQGGPHGEAPLDRPNIETSELLPWANDTVTASLRLSPDDYRETLQKIAGNFTNTGWKDFTKTLTSRGMVDSLNAGTSITVTVGNPVLVSEGLNDNTYQWVISMPARIQYASPNDTDTHDINSVINITVMRVPAKDNILGIQITEWQQT